MGKKSKKNESKKNEEKDDRKVKGVKPQACGCVITTYEVPGKDDQEVITACVPHGLAETARCLMDAGSMLIATADRLRQDQNLQTMSRAMSDIKSKKNDKS